ncbi:MAG: transposase [Rhodospirillales bacterium]|nr:transposase [Rhodospirillales bacterium]
MLAALAEAHRAGRLAFFGRLTALACARAFAAVLAPLKKTKWFVYAKRPFAGPDAVLTYLSRYTHRVAISNRRLVACDDEGVRFRWKDYRADGHARWKTMTLPVAEFIRRFLLHVLPFGFHRIRHYGFLANGQRRTAVDHARVLLAAKPEAPDDRTVPADGSGDAAASSADAAPPKAHRCPCCGGVMIVVETFRRGGVPASRTAAAASVIGIDSS